MAFARSHNLDALYEKCLLNDRKAQHELYKRYYGLMMTISMRYVGNKDDAMEIVNSGFFKIFTKIGDFGQKGSFEGWMKRTMVNTALDFLKLQKEREADIDETNEFEHEIYVQNDIYRQIEEEEIMRIMASVPKMSRTVFNLYVMEGFKHKDISEMLEISEGTSHWHLQNARKILKENLDKMM